MLMFTCVCPERKKQTVFVAKPEYGETSVLSLVEARPDPVILLYKEHEHTVIFSV